MHNGVNSGPYLFNFFFLSASPLRKNNIYVFLRKVEESVADDSTKNIFKNTSFKYLNAYCIVLVMLEETRK